MINWHNPKTLDLAIAETGMSLFSFAKFAGVSRSQLWRIRIGKFGPTLRTQHKIESALRKIKQHNETKCDDSQAVNMTYDQGGR